MKDFSQDDSTDTLPHTASASDLLNGRAERPERHKTRRRISRAQTKHVHGKKRDAYHVFPFPHGLSLYWHVAVLSFVIISLANITIETAAT